MRLIDADALKEYLYEKIFGAKGKIDAWVDAQPTIEAEPVRHGRWMMYATPDDHNIWFACSLCNAAQNKESTYCPNCGARMDKEVQE